MARIRSIHPGFFTDEAVVSVSPIARICIIGLGIEADDKGIFEWKPLMLKMRLFPADNVSMDEILNELAAANLVRNYEMEGRQYGAIRNFRKFQRPKTPNDIHPMPDEIGNYVGLNDAIPEKKKVKEASFPQKGEKLPQMEDVGCRMEDGNIEPNGSMPRRSPQKVAKSLPDDWQPILTAASQALVGDWPRGEFERQLTAFKDHAADKGRTSKDWQAAFRTWIGKANEWRMKNGSGNNSGQRSRGAPPEHNPLVRAVLADREARAAGERFGQSGGGTEDGVGSW